MRVLIVMLLFSFAFAELPSKEVSKGNKAAKAGQTDQAQYHYVKALENKADTSTVMYNLGNAMYDAGEFERAMKIYAGALDSSRSNEQLERAFYNMGTAGLQAQKFDEAIGAYIEALRRDPEDSDAKQNLELAMRMKRQAEQQQKEQNKEQDQENKDQQKQDDQQQQDQQQQDQQKQDDQQKQEDQQKQDQQQQDQQQQQGDSSQAEQGQPMPQQMTKEEAEQLLNALLQDEQNTLEQVRKAKVGQRKKRAKDW